MIVGNLPARTFPSQVSRCEQRHNSLGALSYLTELPISTLQLTFSKIFRFSSLQVVHARKIRMSSRFARLNDLQTRPPMELDVVLFRISSSKYGQRICQKKFEWPPSESSIPKNAPSVCCAIIFFPWMDCQTIQLTVVSNQDESPVGHPATCVIFRLQAMDGSVYFHFLPSLEQWKHCTPNTSPPNKFRPQYASSPTKKCKQQQLCVKFGLLQRNRAFENSFPNRLPQWKQLTSMLAPHTILQVS